MDMTKKEALKRIEELKAYVEQKDKEIEYEYLNLGHGEVIKWIKENNIDRYKLELLDYETDNICNEYNYYIGSDERGEQCVFRCKK